MALQASPDSMIEIRKDAYGYSKENSNEDRPESG